MREWGGGPGDERGSNASTPARDQMHTHLCEVQHVELMPLEVERGVELEEETVAVRGRHGQSLGLRKERHKV